MKVQRISFINGLNDIAMKRGPCTAGTRALGRSQGVCKSCTFSVLDISEGLEDDSVQLTGSCCRE